MHNKNSEFRVVYTPLSGLLFAGVVNCKTGKCEGEQHDVTSSALYAVARKLSRSSGTQVWPLPDGQTMLLRAEIIPGNEVADA